MRRRLVAIAVTAALTLPAAQASALTHSDSLRAGGVTCHTCTVRAGGSWRVSAAGIKWVRTPRGQWTRTWAPRRFVWVRFH